MNQQNIDNAAVNESDSTSPSLLGNHPNLKMTKNIYQVIKDESLIQTVQATIEFMRITRKIFGQLTPVSFILNQDGTPCVITLEEDNFAKYDLQVQFIANFTNPVYVISCWEGWGLIASEAAMCQEEYQKYFSEERTKFGNIENHPLRFETFGIRVRDQNGDIHEGLSRIISNDFSDVEWSL